MRFLIFSILAAACVCKLLVTKSLTDSLRESVKWEVTAYEENPFRSWTEEDVKRILGARHDLRIPRVTMKSQITEALPDNFDAREKWPACIRPVRNQGDCGSCWAFAATNQLTDRLCIHTQRDIILSPQYMIECDKYDGCCNGGNLDSSFRFLEEQGTVEDRCMKYDKNCEKCRETDCPRFKCKAGSVWSSTNVQAVKEQLYSRGPVEGAFDVFQDFLYYKKGVYYHAQGEFLGGHAIEVVGWGVEDGLNYWMCKNSWDVNWGIVGYFKIKMGDCDINNNMITCEPAI